jgi:hypothetical protein
VVLVVDGAVDGGATLVVVVDSEPRPLLVGALVVVEDVIPVAGAAGAPGTAVGAFPAGPPTGAGPVVVVGSDAGWPAPPPDERAAPPVVPAFSGLDAVAPEVRCVVWSPRADGSDGSAGLRLGRPRVGSATGPRCGSRAKPTSIRPM